MKQIIINKPHLLFFALSGITLLIGIINHDLKLDINVHDTYFVIAHLDLSILFFTILNVIDIGYWAIIASQKPLFKKLTFLHSGTTSFVFILIVILYFIPDPLSLDLDRVNSNSVLIPDLYITEIILFYTVLILILVQPLYVVNIICALFRKRIQ